MTKKTLSKTLLYSDNIIAITNRHLCSRPFMEQLERVCQLRPRAIVLREKDMPKADYLSLAHDVISLCKKYDILCILHSFIDVAIELEHPYIHMPLPVLEEYVHNNMRYLDQDASMPDGISTYPHKNTCDHQQFFKIIGTSVHSVEDAIKAQELGAAYMTAGHIFATDCKKGLPPRGLDFLKNVCDSVQIPVYAIGGINIAPNSDNDSDFNVPRLSEVMKYGAAGGCIMSGMMRV